MCTTTITASPESAGTDSLRPWTLPSRSGESLYIVSRGNEFNPSHGVTKGTLDNELVWEERGIGYASGQSPWPGSIGVDSDEKLFISDDHVSRIFIYDKDGNFLDSWGTKGSGGRRA